MSLSPSMRKVLIATATAATLILIVAVLLPALVRPSNCGGNSAALAACRSYVMVLELWGIHHKGQRFQYEQADDETKHWLEDLPGASWIPAARLLARLEDVLLDSASEKRIIMVCDCPYDNVPQRRFGRSPMAHAVAYSTGETGLISPEEFARLDLSGFTDLQTLGETTRVEAGGAANGSQPIRSETYRTSSAAGSRR